ncbi:hypothetical protein EYF80_018678 [Liparis tanakae]|uniref:Uncharacterized protein n=1 Tax=Liparis tanakae TaxID=230148 RepID=A0A4Z2HZQ8_9TELE|nr:hypothetical protein EYF80_018678 [Liparis tanakae]
MAVSVISLSGMAGAQPACDPLTQYERNGDCCKMCAPGKPGDAKGNVKVCVELCLGNKKEPLRETRVLITNPTDAIEDESLVPDRQSSQEEADARTPEENEDELSQELSDDYVLTDNGNVVTQEDGKSAVLSRQESQTQTLQTETSCGHSDRWG